MVNPIYYFFWLLVVGTSFSVVAGETAISAKCGEATIEIKGTTFPNSETAFSKIILTAESKNESIRLVFDNTDDGLWDAEYFHAACVKGKDKRPYIVFQNYCGGSGCRDLDNYGIIDAKSLRALLMPDDNNRSRASQILGKKVPYLFDYKERFF